MEQYYKPSATFGTRVVIPDNATEEVVNAQRKMAADLGLLPVRNYTKRPAHDFFTYPPVERFEVVKDDIGNDIAYNHSWVTKARIIRLSQEKILADTEIAPLLPKLSAAVANNATLANWWTSNLSYLRGSPVARLAMETLGLTQEQLESLAKRCLA